MTDAKAETPILCNTHAKSWLIGKDSDAGRDWGQDEMAGWHHRHDGHEFEWILCFSEQSSSQKSNQLILASHSLHLQPPPPLRCPFFLPCPSSGEVRSSGEVAATLFFVLRVFHSALLVLSRVLPAQPRSEETLSGRVARSLTSHGLPTSGPWATFA